MTGERLQSTLTPQQLAEFRQILDDMQGAADYVEVHKSELTVRYAERWIAVTSNCVIADAGGQLELMAKLRDLGVDPATVWTWFFPKEHRGHLLWR